MNKALKYFKIGDPIVQSFIFTVLAFSFNYKFFFKYYLPGIISWQLGSWILHLFVSGRYKLRKERWVYFASVVIIMSSFFLIRHNLSEMTLKNFASQELMSVPLYELTFVILQSFFAFWYFTIAVREIKHVVKRKLG